MEGKVGAVMLTSSGGALWWDRLAQQRSLIGLLVLLTQPRILLSRTTRIAAPITH